MTTIRRIDVGSAFKVGLILNALIFAIIGLFIALMQIFFFSIFSDIATSSSSFNGSNVTPQDLQFFKAFGIVGACMFWLFGSVAAGIFGGIYFAIAALLYNLTSKMVGGVEVQLSGFNPSDTYDFGGEPSGKRKRIPQDDIL